MSNRRLALISGIRAIQLTERDRRTLEDAHIDENEVLREVAALIRRDQDIFLPHITSDALPNDERHFLRRGGAELEGPRPDQVRSRNLSLTSEYAKMATQAYTLNEVANLLDESLSKIQQHIEARTLYTVIGHRGCVCPRWQFHDQTTLPGLELVLKAISPEAHPIAVQRFFLTVCPDLESPIFDIALSPRDWLISGHQVNEVVILTGEL